MNPDVMCSMCVDPKQSGRFFLYEVENEDAFKAHLESAHYRSFDADVATWVLSKQVDILRRIAPTRDSMP